MLPDTKQMSDTHPDRDMLQDFAFGCLDDTEAGRVRAHLAGCPACRGQVEELEQTLGSLALALPPMEPPADLEQKLMTRVTSAADGMTLEPIAMTGRSQRHSTGRSTPRYTAEGRHAGDGARGWWRRSGSRVLGALAAGGVLVLGAGNIIQWQQAATARRTASVPGLSLIVLVGVDTGVGAYGTVVLDRQDNGGVLAVRGLRRLDPSQTYQLWLYKESEQRSGGTFAVSTDGYGNLLLEVPKDFEGFTSVGITIEPAGGSLMPSGMLVAKGAP